MAERAVQIIGSEADWDQMAGNAGIELRDHTAMKVDSSLIALQIVSRGQGAATISEDFLRNYIK
ncbi:hypothetical protein [Ruegeria arenilitoris]|uniref:hypothetical protein n=1 Tax=Ruegeria arenilitoris TaxID=1173585 RepID=UPI0014805898|nr:hypothetical protein [Ruegeria arenilitoris]